MKLTDTQIKKTKPDKKVKKLSDGKGLILMVNPKGAKYWRLNYRFAGKQKTLALGVYPVVTLAQARDKAFQAKSLIAQGIDPSETKKKEKQVSNNSNAFKKVAQLWFDKKRVKWKDSHAKDVWKSLENNIFNHIGQTPINEIKPKRLTKILKLIESRGSLEQLKKIRQRCNNIFIYAKAKELIDSNPCEGLEILLQEHTSKNFNSIKLKDLPDLIKSIKVYQCEPTTRAGLEIAMHTFLRTNEIRFAKWNEIDFENKRWVIPAKRMKMNREHITPLSPRVIEILKELEPITGQYPFIFASSHKPNTQPMSENAMLYALYRMNWKGKMTVHGFRHLASTTLRELGYPSHIVEKQLSHESKNKIEATYNKAEYLADRIKMMNDWSSFLENANGQIIPIHSKKAKN